MNYRLKMNKIAMLNRAWASKANNKQKPFYRFVLNNLTIHVVYDIISTNI